MNYQANKLTNEHQCKINIRTTAAASNPKKKVRTNIKPFDSKVLICPIEATKHEIQESDVIAKESTLLSYESYEDPILLKHYIYKIINANFGSKYSVVGKEMAKIIEAKQSPMKMIRNCLNT